jgi:pSer/pThr/pTyr-binding forkhead associated (FHA) protein
VPTPVEPLPAAVAEPNVALVVLEEGRPGRTVHIRRDVATIGRLPECDVVVSDPGASRRHAEIRHRDGAYVVTDLGSTNGTLVNAEPVGSRELHDGDRITVGTTVLEFRRR